MLSWLYVVTMVTYLNADFVFGFRVFTVERRRPQGIFQWGYFVILFPFRFVYSTVYDLMKFVCKLNHIYNRMCRHPVYHVVFTC